MRTLAPVITVTGSLCTQPMPGHIRPEFHHDHRGDYTGQDVGCLDAPQVTPTGSHRESVVTPAGVRLISCATLRPGAWL